MSTVELILLIQKKDPTARKELFETYYGKLATLARRYAKNQTQADEIVNVAFNTCITKLQHNRHAKNIDLDQFLEKEFILEAVSYIKSVRSEYYVSSTVYAVENNSRNYNLFESNDLIDFNQVDTEVLIKSLQQLVPSQRLIFNLHVIDGMNLKEATSILESSEETVKSNLEKSRFNLQKNLEKNSKSIKT